MNRCSLWEVNDILEYLPYTDRNLWEATRLSAFIDAKSHFKGIHKYTDICKFEWDKSTHEEIKNTSISNEEIERLKKLSSQQWEN